MESLERIKELEEELARLKGTSNTSKIEEKDVPFTSLTFSPLNLQTGKIGDSEPEQFTEFGETREIDYKTAREIVRRNKSFIRDGKVWIDDAEFIRKEHLNFKNILNAGQIRSLANDKNRDSFENKFVALTQSQMQAVIQLLYEQISKGKHDMNIINVVNNTLNIDMVAQYKRFQELIKPIEK